MHTLLRPKMIVDFHTAKDEFDGDRCVEESEADGWVVYFCCVWFEGQENDKEGYSECSDCFKQCSVLKIGLKENEDV